MKTIGLIGGIGPETTVIYYRLLIAAGRTRIIINSVESGTLIPLVVRQDRPAVADFLVAEVERLVAAGADVGLIAANTPHMCFAEIQRCSPIPLVSIVEATAEHVSSRGFHRAALFGTRMTMEGTFFQDVFTRRGIALIVPSDSERAYVHDKYMGELFKGVIRPETRRGLLAVIDAVAGREEIDAVILGGTELSLILTGDAHNGIPLIDTTRIHVNAALAAAGEGVPKRSDPIQQHP
jgi:aspartate racemase